MMRRSKIKLPTVRSRDWSWGKSLHVVAEWNGTLMCHIPGQPLTVNLHSPRSFLLFLVVSFT